jgi:hypothetical protein
MTTLSEKSHEDGSPFTKGKHLRDGSLKLKMHEVIKEGDIEYYSPSRRSVKSEDDSPQKIRAGSPSKRKILASKFQKNTSFEDKEKTEWGERLLDEAIQID